MVPILAPEECHLSLVSVGSFCLSIATNPSSSNDSAKVFFSPFKKLISTLHVENLSAIVGSVTYIWIYVNMLKEQSMKQRAL